MNPGLLPNSSNNAVRYNPTTQSLTIGDADQTRSLIGQFNLVAGQSNNLSGVSDKNIVLGSNNTITQGVGLDSALYADHNNNGNARNIVVGNGNTLHGNRSSGSDGGCIVIGNNLTLGSPSSSTKANAVFIGSNIQSSSPSSSVAIGASAQVGSTSVAIGASASALGSTSVTVGASAAAGGSSSTSLGYSAAAAATSSVAVGVSATVNSSATNGIAIGSGAALNSSGAYGVAIGVSSAASNGYTIAVGHSAQSTGGQGVAVGYGATAFGAYGTALGTGARSSMNGMTSFGIGAAASNKSQASIFQLAGTPSTTSETELLCGTSGNTRILIRAFSMMAFRATITARNMSNVAASKVWFIDGAITMNTGASTTALMGTPIVTTINGSGTDSWTATVSADTTNGALKVSVYSGSTGIYWHARIDAVENNYS